MFKSPDMRHRETSILFLLFVCFYGSAQAGIAAYDISVAKDGTGNYVSVQEAINAVPDFRKKQTVIFIRNGTYREKLMVPESKNIEFIGETVERTILTYDDFAGKKSIFGEDLGTSGSASIYIYGNNFTARNITFENSAGPVGQAVAAFISGDKARFFYCRFLGFQDTLYTYGKESGEYFNHCYIEGTVDFIFGSATAVFDSCTLVGKGGGYFTAASTPEGKHFGYVFLSCEIRGTPPGSYFLGRPWRPFAKTVFIRCDMGKVVNSQGWDNWRNAENEKTAYYAEYKNTGEGAVSISRVSWSHQLTDDEARQYTLRGIFPDWNPL